MAAHASEPTLTVTVGGKTATHTPGDLLGQPGVVTINVPNDVAYRRPMTFRALPMATLLAGVPPSASVRFSDSTGFSATLPAAALLASAEDGARAYLAIEPADAQWPPLRSGNPASAGPFYLVWLNPERARIVSEQWPFQVAKIDQVASLGVRYPAILPAPNISPNGSVARGYVVFTKNCIVCHTLNLGGDGWAGPDLNVPYSATEYMRADALRRLVRDPQSLRRYPATRMPAFDTATLSDRELNDLFDYLRHMANRKVPLSPTGK